MMETRCCQVMNSMPPPFALQTASSTSPAAPQRTERTIIVF